MKRLLPYSDADILRRVAERRGVNGRIAQEEAAARRRALLAHTRSEMAKAGINAAVLDDPEAREMMLRAYRGSFTYQESPADAARVSPLRQQRDALLPSTMKSEEWAVGDCECVVQRVYHMGAAEESQTFHAVPCAAHAGMAIDALHDAIEEATQRRARVHAHIQEEYASLVMSAGAEIPGAVVFSWSGQGADRILTIHVDIIGPARKEQLAAWALAEFGDRVRVA